MTEKLKKCKDQAEVIAVMREHSSDEDEFKRITTEFKRLARAIPQPALEAVYYHCCEEEWRPRAGFATEEIWDPINGAKERGFLVVSDENRVDPDETHPKICRVLEKLEELRVFITTVGEDLPTWFEEEHDYPFDLLNRDFWRDPLYPDRFV